MRSMATTFTVLAVAGGAAVAEDLRPAPDYYLDAVVTVTAAQSLARSCTAVSVDPLRLAAISDEVLARLAEDGFDPSSPDPTMEDPSAVLNARLRALFEGHGLSDGVSEAQVCAAARAEMAAESDVGNVLLEVAG